MDEKSDMIARIQYLITKDSKNKSKILRELHLSTSTLSDWEKGKGNPSTSAIIKLANYFNVTSDYILFGTERTENSELTTSENKWLEIFHMFSEPEKQNLIELIQNLSGQRDFVQFITYMNKLSKQERQICIAFIRGVLAEKNLKEL